jgi:hypothetical protein
MLLRVRWHPSPIPRRLWNWSVIDHGWPEYVLGGLGYLHKSIPVSIDSFRCVDIVDRVFIWCYPHNGAISLMQLDIRDLEALFTNLEKFQRRVKRARRGPGMSRKGSKMIE